MRRIGTGGGFAHSLLRTDFREKNHDERSTFVRYENELLQVQRASSASAASAPPERTYGVSGRMESDSEPEDPMEQLFVWFGRITMLMTAQACTSF